MLTVLMKYKKSTKNTHVYESDNDVLPTVYVKREALADKPASIKVTIEVVES